MLPDELTQDDINHLIEILSLVQKHDNKSLEQSFVLHGFDHNNSSHKNLLNDINHTVTSTYAHKKCRVQIVIPELDRKDCIDDKKLKEAKGQYKELQNKISSNRREHRQKHELETNTEKLHETTEVREYAEKEEEHTKALNLWLKENPNFSLIKPTANRIAQAKEAGNQQHQEQEQTREQQNRKQQEQEQEQKQQVELEYYSGGENLIDRSNIETMCTTFWNEIDNDVRNHYQNQFTKNREELSLDKVFNAWVGSHLDAKGIICKMTRKAAEELIQYKEFTFGLYLEDLPAGFFLKKEPNTEKLILCFDKEKNKTYRSKSKRGCRKEISIYYKNKP